MAQTIIYLLLCATRIGYWLRSQCVSPSTNIYKTKVAVDHQLDRVTWTKIKVVSIAYSFPPTPPYPPLFLAEPSLNSSIAFIC